MHPMAAELLKVLFPQENACHLCGRWAQRSVLCARCLAELNAQQIALDRQVHDRRDALTASIACWKHRSVPRRLVHQLKYHADPRAAVLLGEGMASALESVPDMLSRMNLAVPVPLHAEREKKRGYNQAALLAGEICQRAGLKLEQRLLFRVYDTGAQVRRDRAERLAAMQGAFAVTGGAEIQGKRILLVDDVFTTGATALSCAQALRKAGAAEVYVVTACRA